jgi:hypothetical protein
MFEHVLGNEGRSVIGWHAVPVRSASFAQAQFLSICFPTPSYPLPPPPLPPVSQLAVLQGHFPLFYVLLRRYISCLSYAVMPPDPINPNRNVYIFRLYFAHSEVRRLDLI